MDRLLLKQCQKDGVVVDIGRAHFDDDRLTCVILAVGGDLLLVHQISHNDVKPDGFAVLCAEDITFLSVRTPVLEAWTNAVRGQQTPYDVQSVVDNTVLDDWVAALNSALGQCGLAEIMRERIDTDATHPVRSVRVEGDCLICGNVDLDGSDDGVVVLRIEDVTRVDFATEYDRGLDRMNRSPSE